MLRDQVRRRIKAGRKKRWAEYSQAKETALGKPMRQAGKYPDAALRTPATVEFHAAAAA
jgi:hypothetical protein